MEAKIGYRIYKDIKRPSRDLIERLREFSAPELCDGSIVYNAMDYHIKPMVTRKKICGPAVTVKLTMGDSLMVTKAVDMAQPGDVIVLANKGSRMELSLSTTAVVSLLLSRIWQMLLNSGKVLLLVLMLFLLSRSRGDNPLLKAKNCIITPHISWAAQASRQRIMDITVDNIKAFLDGNTVNRVNK